MPKALTDAILDAHCAARTLSEKAIIAHYTRHDEWHMKRLREEAAVMRARLDDLDAALAVMPATAEAA